jgi:hypothetical protein
MACALVRCAAGQQCCATAAPCLLPASSRPAAHSLQTVLAVQALIASQCHRTTVTCDQATCATATTTTTLTAPPPARPLQIMFGAVMSHFLMGKQSAQTEAETEVEEEVVVADGAAVPIMARRRKHE